MKLPFVKMQGTGNDYIYINAFDNHVPNPEELAVKISHRRFGVGGDGLVLIGPSEGTAAKMTMYNADGSKAEICGNALRCVGRFLWDRQMVEIPEFKVETDAGIKRLGIRLDAQKSVQNVWVDMGEPNLSATAVSSSFDDENRIDAPFDFGPVNCKASLVSMGNPHCVIFVDDLDQTPVSTWGPMIENHPLFTNRTNVEFVQVKSVGSARQRTWERGSGETWACGTGACATAVAGILTDRFNQQVEIELLGGKLNLSWNGPGSPVILEGEAQEVFTGEYPL